MIVICTKDNEASSVMKKIIDAANKTSEDSLYNLETWDIIHGAYEDTDEKDLFIYNTDKDWEGNVCLAIDVVKHDEVLIRPFELENAEVDNFKNKRGHIQGRFIGALLSNMSDEFLKIEVIPEMD